MGFLKPHVDVFQLGSSRVSKIEPALQDTIVAAIAGLGIAANTCPSRKPRSGDVSAPAMQ